MIEPTCPQVGGGVGPPDNVILLGLPNLPNLTNLFSCIEDVYAAVGIAAAKTCGFWWAGWLDRLAKVAQHPSQPRIARWAKLLRGWAAALHTPTSPLLPRLPDRQDYCTDVQVFRAVRPWPYATPVPLASLTTSGAVW